MRVTLKNIAEAATVSPSLVSFYLRNPDTTRVAAATRKRIDKVIKELGYVHNKMAAEMRTGVTKTVALLLDFHHPSTSGMGAMDILKGVLAAAAEGGYGVKVYNTNHPERDLKEIREYGINHIICFVFSKDYQRKLAEFCGKNNVKLCFLQESCVENYPLIYTDDLSAMKSLVRTFHDHGRRRFAFLGPLDDVNFSVNRYHGWLDGLKECGLTFHSQLCSRQHKIADHYKDLHRMFSLPEEERPDAIVCTDDRRAMCVEFIAMEKGIKVPDDCEISGYGNSTSRDSYYPMYTVEQHLNKIGKKAFNAVFDVKNKSELSMPIEIIYHEGAGN